MNVDERFESRGSRGYVRTLVWATVLASSAWSCGDDGSTTGGDDSNVAPTTAATTIATPEASTSDGSTSVGATSTSNGSTGPSLDGGSTGSGGLGSTGPDTATGGPPIFDLGIPDAPPVKEAEPWLVRLAVVDGVRHLFQIDIETAATTDLCTVTDGATGMPLTGNTSTITFTRDDRLLFVRGQTVLWELALPSCVATEIGTIGFGGVNGICPDEGNDLYGLSTTSDVLLAIDSNTGVGTEIGALGQDWGSLGGTWNEDEQRVLGINSNTDALYEINQMSGAATQVQVLPLLFASVGMEYHPLTSRIYACTNDSHLYRLEDDGTLTDLGDTGLGTCDNLGAPWSPDVPIPSR